MKAPAAPSSPEDIQRKEALGESGGIIQDESTGVPGFRTWTGIYWFVFGSLVLWIALLALLSRALS